MFCKYRYLAVYQVKIVLTVFIIFPVFQVFAFNLGSPLQGVEPVLDKAVTSVFDRTVVVTGAYVRNGRVETYTGEVGEKRFGVFDIDCYKNEKKEAFVLEGNYKGAHGEHYLCYDGHPGIDFTASESVVIAVEDGTVKRVINSMPDTPDTGCGCYGNLVDIEHDNGFISRYAHLRGGSKISVSKGMRVYKGQPIAVTGNSGVSYGEHLHFELIGNSGRRIDPFDYWSPPAPSTKFSFGNTVVVVQDAAPKLNVRNSPSGSVLGTQIPGAKGTIIAGPEYATYWWWEVDFESGVNGWVAEHYLRKANQSIPTTITKLNDTGITTCSNNSQNGLPCPVSGFPGQDGEHGRDALAAAGLLQKVGGGSAGFDFTKLDDNGNPLPASATEWSCVKDNHTGLIWEEKATSGLRSMHHTYTWYNPDSSTNGGHSGTQNGGSCSGSSCDTHGYVQAVNAQGLCGANDWRMPAREELRGIVDYSRFNPAIDNDFFLHISPFAWFWSASPYVGYVGSVWGVSFSGGVDKSISSGANLVGIRLVRD